MLPLIQMLCSLFFLADEAAAGLGFVFSVSDHIDKCCLEASDGFFRDSRTVQPQFSTIPSSAERLAAFTWHSIGSSDPGATKFLDGWFSGWPSGGRADSFRDGDCAGC